MKKELRLYRTKTGKEPFTDWLATLKDVFGRAQITNRLNRVTLGNYGDYKYIDAGVFKLRIHYGPGYRLYFAEQEKQFCYYSLVEINEHKKETPKKP